MKGLTSIQENELDGALNAVFLNSYSQKEDESLARLCMDRNYDVVIDPLKEEKFLARLNKQQGRGKKIIWLVLTLLILLTAMFLLFNGEKKEKKVTPPAIQFTDSISDKNESSQNREFKTQTENTDPIPQTQANIPFSITDNNPAPSMNELTVEAPPFTADNKQAAKDPEEEKELPYFDDAGIEYFGKIKERMLQKLIKIDDFLYAKTEPGTTIYKGTEVIIAPFVMSNFAVTNLQYKTFLADLSAQGRIEEMKKCLPKEELWKEYGCNILAKDYFGNESYNDFPVVNVSREASLLFCEWLEEQTNQRLSGPAKKFSTSKGGQVKKKQVVVRLPYDHEWIYSADAAYTLIPDCPGYNTIYDASEGLVDKDFFKRTSQISKRDMRKETRMDKLADVNRFGMTEAEMIGIYKEAMNYRKRSSSGFINYSDPAAYPYNIEACCLAGHVCEIINVKDGGSTVRGCCWKSKEEYLKMMEAYKKHGASPFIGFRVMIMNSERGSDKDPFW
jgi:hypothetical protein